MKSDREKIDQECAETCAELLPLYLLMDAKNIEGAADYIESLDWSRLRLAHSMLVMGASMSTGSDFNREIRALAQCLALRAQNANPDPNRN